MEWIKVENDLPPDGENVLVLVEAYFQGIGDPLCQKRSHRIFEGMFERCKGWNVPFAPIQSYVNYWMKRPDDPNENVR